MNMREFAALHSGDTVLNPLSNSTGEITETTDSGVRVRWGAAGQTFFISVQSTAWMHWIVVGEEGA